MLADILQPLSQAVRDRVGRVIGAATRQQRKLRIGVDIRPFYEPLTGVGWYLHHLLHALAKYEDVELYLFGDARVTDRGPRIHCDLPEGARLCTFDLRGRGEISRLTRAASAAAYVAWMKLVDCDVMFGANYFLPRLHAAVARRRVVTVHDLTYKRFPELLQNETLHNLERHMQRELTQSDAVICVSESTRRDLLHYYQADRRRIVTVLSGVAKVGWKAEAIVPRLRRPGVHHLDYLEPEVLAAVYARAELFVFPSIYEGFGFPLLEAMAHGVPTIAARSSSLPEVGADATLYFEPHDANALAKLIERVTSNAALRTELVARGRKRVAELRWDHAAEKTLEVLRRAAQR